MLKKRWQDKDCNVREERKKTKNQKKQDTQI